MGTIQHQLSFCRSVVAGSPWVCWFGQVGLDLVWWGGVGWGVGWVGVGSVSRPLHIVIRVEVIM